MSITITTANICGNPIRPKVAVRRRMRRALARPGVVFGQEVAQSNHWRRGNYSAMWHAVASVHGKETLGGPHEVPISIPADWQMLGDRSILVHGGLRRVSPARYITEVRCQVGGRLFAFLNCHPVSKPRPGVSSSGWRIQHWDEYHARLTAVIAELHGQGYTVVVGGDMNKGRVPVLHPEQTVLTASGLDHLWGIPAAGSLVTVTHRSSVGRTTLMDHPILTVTIEVVAR